MAHVIEKKEYGPDSSEAEIETIKNCVYLHQSDVIYWKEVPVMSCWQVEQFGEKIDELLQNLDSFSLLIDLTDSKPPNAKIRESLRSVFAPLKHRGLKKAAAFTDKNFLINVAAKFVLGGSGLDFSVHTKRSDAEAALADDH
ncbi:MAG: hypothetical protein MJK04_27925 [Psychrosphaera sp.]|nr:hypothetical protein [Psychrosphaera sp.]